MLGTPPLVLRTTLSGIQRCSNKMASRHRHVSAARHNYIALTRSSTLTPGSFLNPRNDSILPEHIPPTKMPIFDDPPTTSPNSKPACCAGKSTSLPKPTSVQQEQGDLPELSSLEMLVSDPVTACHGCPIQQAVATDEKAESGDGRVDDSALPPAGGDDDSPEAANRAAPTPRYRPAYELTDAAHERLGRGTHAPVLNA